MNPSRATYTDDADLDKKVAVEIANADRLLVVAAAGLSISTTLPNNPYHSAKDFAYHYPRTAEYGYRTAYEAMGLMGDHRVPEAVRVAHTARHFLNMRWNFPPTKGYEWLRNLAKTFKEEDVFAWTSNVDACFARAGFDPERVYTTQGQMDRMQCTNCGNVYECEDQLRTIDKASVNGELTDMSLRLQCPKCGSGNPLPNLRGGDWFDHTPYLATQKRLLNWLDESVKQKLHIAVIEVGVGPNTPIVTRIPAEAFASAVTKAGGHTVYLRINPDAGRSDIPESRIAFYRKKAGWAGLEPIITEAIVLRQSDNHKVPHKSESGLSNRDLEESTRWCQRYRDILESLRTPR